MAKGHDDDNTLKGCKYSIDDETGKLMSTLVRQYVLGEWKLETMLFPTERSHDIQAVCMSTSSQPWSALKIVHS